MKDLKELIREINEKPEEITTIPWADETNGFEDSRIRDIIMGVYPLELAKVVADCILDAFNLCYAMDDVRAMGKNPYDKNDPMLYEKTYDVFNGGEWKPYNMKKYIKHLINNLKNRKGGEKIHSIVLQCCSATPPPVESDEREEESTLQNVQRNVFTDDDAKAIWKKLIDLGYIDEDIKPVNLSLSMMRAVVKAFYYAWDKENLSWVPFKERWGKDLQHARDSQESERLCEQLKHQL